MNSTDQNAMSDSTNPLPPRLPATSPPLPAAGMIRLPLGEDPAEQIPIPNALAAVEAILRQPRRVMFQLRQPGAGRLIAALLLSALICGLGYGLVVGTFSGGAQLWAAPVKIAAGLLITALICLPSLYIFSCLGGSRARLPEIFGLVAGLLSLMTVLLVGFAPVAWVFSQSTQSVAVMGALHLVFWFIATCFGLRFLCAGFVQLTARSDSGLRIWILIYLLVAAQMTTALRPMVGTADTLLPVEKKFFLRHWADCWKP